MPDQVGIQPETRADAWRRRRRHLGAVDFTMMYAAHDAFDRDLDRLTAAVERGSAVTEPMRGTWAMFAEQLHTHHTAEDEALWPALYDVASDDERGVLEAMEQEHATLDPMIDRAGAALTAGDPAVLATELTGLRRTLSAHLVHEEDEALPLLERRLGQAGWDAFGNEIRRRVGGMAAGARYLPWVLDDAEEQVRATILGILPRPARLLYRRVWEPKYRAAAHL